MFCDISAFPRCSIDMLIDLNVTALTNMTTLVLPYMKEKKLGAIVNLSSASAIRPTGLLAVYSATKAYVDFFSQALNQEAGPGVCVQV